MIAGCDGFHGICRPLIPVLLVSERSYPFAWLGILADAAPSTDELIYSRHADGFALYSMRSPEVSRLYLQVPPGEPLDRWPDDRIWAELKRRFSSTAGPSPRARSPTNRSPRCAASSPRPCATACCSWPATPAHRPADRRQGPHLALSDVVVLANALRALLARRDLGPGRRLLRHLPVTGSGAATHFSWWMTSMLHVNPEADGFDRQLMLNQLRYVTSSQAAALSLAENYTGYRPVRVDL